MKPAQCAACGAPADMQPGADFILSGRDFNFDEPKVKLCPVCWRGGDDDETWNDRITNRVRERRANLDRSTPATTEQKAAAGKGGAVE